MAGYKFDYETKLWGGEVLRLMPSHFRASRLYYALQALSHTKGKVLDTGCGLGDFSEAIKHYYPHLDIYAIDISKKAVSRARKRVPAVSFAVADVQALPFKDNYFDAVVCFDLIEHVRYPQKALREIARVLKPGGVFHLFIPTEGNVFTPEGLLIRLGWKGKELYGGHPHSFTPNGAKDMVDKAGFTIVKSRWGDHFIHQALEILHFTTLLLRRKNISTTVEGLLSTSGSNPAIYPLKLVKNFLATLSYYETRALYWLPALGLHLTLTRNETSPKTS